MTIKGISVGGEETKLLQYADDMTAVLADVNSAQALLDLLEIFKKASGLMMNFTKTEGMWIGSSRNNKTAKPLGIKLLRLPTVENTLMRKACNFVFDCLQGNVCTPFKNYFNFLTHNRDTRNCRATVVLPKVKLEFARKSFYFSGANIFNSLPLKTRQTSSRVLFRQYLNELFL